jgi:hypothetical protein
MTKSSTLENVLSKHQSSQNKIGKSKSIPEKESLNMIMRYSMALLVVKTQQSGIHYLILN